MMRDATTTPSPLLLGHLAPLVVALSLTSWTASSAVAQEEIICDPENPACQAPAPVPAPEPAPAPGPDEEIICDPENPGCRPPEEEQPDGPTLVPVEPALEPVIEAGDGSGVGGFERVQFLGTWATALAVDLSFDGGGEDVVEAVSGLGLRLEYEASQRMRVVLEGVFFHWMGGRENPGEVDLLVNATGWRALYEARLGEAYVAWRGDRLSLRLGNLLTPWGSTDIVRPGDVINPRDLRFGLTDGGLLPQWTAEVAWQGIDWSATALVVPFFEPDRVALFGRDTALLASPAGQQALGLRLVELAGRLVSPSAFEEVQGLLYGGTAVPDEDPSNASAGLRLSATKWNTDFGLGYFFGWDRTPWVEVDEDLRQLLNLVARDCCVLQDGDVFGFFGRNPQGVGLAASVLRSQQEGRQLSRVEWLRRHTVVADLARYFGPIGARVDVAFSPAQTFQTVSLEPTRRPTLSGALGLSWERADSEERLALTLEAFGVYPFEADSGLARALVEEARRVPGELLLVEDGLYGVAAALVWTLPWIGSDLQLGGLSTLRAPDLVLSASLEHRLTPWLALRAGVTIFEGPTPADGLSLGGLYDRNDAASLGVFGEF